MSADPQRQDPISHRRQSPPVQLALHIRGEAQCLDQPGDAVRRYGVAAGEVVGHALPSQADQRPEGGVGLALGPVGGQQVAQREGGRFHAVRVHRTPGPCQAPPNNPTSYFSDMGTMPPLRDRFARLLHELRAEAALSLAQVAKKTGLSRTAISELERGKYGKALDTMEAVAIACGAQLHILALRREDRDLRTVLDACDHLPPDGVAALARLALSLERLPPMERDLLAWTAEVRVDALSGAAPRAVPGQR